jgi:hypothetical protein
MLIYIADLLGPVWFRHHSPIALQNLSGVIEGLVEPWSLILKSLKPIIELEPELGKVKLEIICVKAKKS